MGQICLIWFDPNITRLLNGLSWSNRNLSQTQLYYTKTHKKICQVHVVFVNRVKLSGLPWNTRKLPSPSPYFPLIISPPHPFFSCRPPTLFTRKSFVQFDGFLTPRSHFFLSEIKIPIRHSSLMNEHEAPFGIAKACNKVLLAGQITG